MLGLAPGMAPGLPAQIRGGFGFGDASLDEQGSQETGCVTAAARRPWPMPFASSRELRADAAVRCYGAGHLLAGVSLWSALATFGPPAWPIALGSWWW